jgi:hypothetical protein
MREKECIAFRQGEVVNPLSFRGASLRCCPSVLAWPVSDREDSSYSRLLFR